MLITNPILMFAFIMFLLLAAPAVFERMKMPGIVGLIMAGILVGPHAAGILRPEGSIELFSSVGLIYIMFLAGLEINLHEFSRQKKYSIVFGTLTFLLPMVLGTLGARALFSFSWPAAVLLASMFASHTLIPFPATVRLGISRHRSVVASVGGTIITDTAALLVLAFIVEMVSTNLTPVFIVRQLAFLLLLIIFAMWGLPRLTSLFFRVLSPDGVTEFVLILALVFLTSYFAQLAGVEPIIGAFFAGLALSQMIADQSSLKNRLEFVGNALFIPFFLISVGMLVNMNVIFSTGKVWPMAVFMVACVIAGKYVSAVIFSKAMKFSMDEANLIFGLSINQAAATLAAVIVGYRLGIFDVTVLNGTIIMIFVTCIIGPFFTEKYGRRIALASEESLERPLNASARIMVAVGRSESVPFLTDLALMLHPKGSKEPVFPLHVVQDGEDVDRRIIAGEKILSQMVARAVSAEVPVSPISRIDINVHGGILRALKEWRVDTFIMGSSRYGSDLGTMLFGVHHKICDESRAMLFLCQMEHPLSMDRSAYVMVPPLLERQPGFEAAFSSVKQLAVANKLKFNVIGASDTVQSVQRMLNTETAGVEVSFTVLSQWNSLAGHLNKIGLKENDAIILMSSRKGRLAWRPSLERLYQTVGRQFLKNNIILVHPPEAERSEGKFEQFDFDGAPRADREMPFLINAPIKVQDSAPEAALETLLRSQFPDERILKRLMKNFLPLDPVELSEEIVLFHTHTKDVQKPVVLVGTNQGGAVFPDIKRPSRAFFVLISPEDQPALHLKTLARVARFAQDFLKKG